MAPENPQAISLLLSGEVVRALMAVADRGAFVDATLRRALRLSPGSRGKSTGRRPKHRVEELADCLSVHLWTTGEFQRRAAETLDMSKSTFYRLLDRGRGEWLFRQGADCRWRTIPKVPK